MKQLTLAQQRTEGEVHELFVAQKELTWTMKDVHKQLGGLAQSVGHGLEAYAMERIPRILAEHCGFVTESSVPETIYADDRGNEIDIVCRGTIAGRPESPPSRAFWRMSSRSPPCRVDSSIPWQWAQCSARSGWISRWKSGSAARAGAAATRMPITAATAWAAGLLGARMT